MLMHTRGVLGIAVLLLAACGGGNGSSSMRTAVATSTAVPAEDTPTPTPTPPPSGCRMSSDCGAASLCFTQEQVAAGCVTPKPVDDCLSDGDCGTNQVCEAEPACPSLLQRCVAACADAGGCDPSQTCDGSGHCVAKPCASDVDCPVHFACRVVCSRRLCRVDGDCDGGFCVGGGCYDDPGVCRPVPS
jgi:hypothetical protein